MMIIIIVTAVETSNLTSIITNLLYWSWKRGVFLLCSIYIVLPMKSCKIVPINFTLSVCLSSHLFSYNNSMRTDEQCSWNFILGSFTKRCWHIPVLLMGISSQDIDVFLYPFWAQLAKYVLMQKMCQKKVWERNESYTVCSVYFSTGHAVPEIIEQTWTNVTELLHYALCPDLIF
jgi:hypothetical protein